MMLKMASLTEKRARTPACAFDNRPCIVVDTDKIQAARRALGPSIGSTDAEEKGPVQKEIANTSRETITCTLSVARHYGGRVMGKAYFGVTA
jgi:hypothetical protein